MKNRPILSLDFDGVIHRYDSKWEAEDVIPDGVVPGFFEWAAKASKVFRLVIYSTRSSSEAGRSAMRTWLVNQAKLAGASIDVEGARILQGTGDVAEFSFASEKPKAFLMIDDRGIRFEGDWSSPDLDPETLLAFRPWNKRGGR